MSAQKTLDQCREGDVVSIQRILGTGALRKRLLEMGLTCGERIRIVKYAPLRDPLELTIKGFHVSLRVAEARGILVNAAAHAGE